MALSIADLFFRKKGQSFELPHEMELPKKEIVKEVVKEPEEEEDEEEEKKYIYTYEFTGTVTDNVYESIYGTVRVRATNEDEAYGLAKDAADSADFEYSGYSDYGYNPEKTIDEIKLAGREEA